MGMSDHGHSKQVNLGSGLPTGQKSTIQFGENVNGLYSSTFNGERIGLCLENFARQGILTLSIILKENPPSHLMKPSLRHSEELVGVTLLSSRRTWIVFIPMQRTRFQLQEFTLEQIPLSIVSFFPFLSFLQASKVISIMNIYILSFITTQRNTSYINFFLVDCWAGISSLEFK